MPMKSKLFRGLLAGGLAAVLTTGVAFASIGKGTVTAEPSLRMRSQPNTSSSTLATAPTNAQVDVLEDAGNGWYKVSYRDVEGYMSGQWLSIALDGAVNDGAAPQQPDAAETGHVNAGPLNVRSGPGTSYKKVGSLSQGASVTVLEKADGWYKIASGSVTGYVSAQYITLDTVAAPAPAEPVPAVPAETAPADPAPAQPAEPETGYVNSGPLNVRSGPGTGYKKVGSLSQGAAISVVEKLDGWYKIAGDSVTGYVSAQYVTLGALPDPDAAAKDAVSDDSTGYVNTSALNVRSGPGTGYEKVGTVRIGDEVAITEKLDGWYKITSGGVTGYVSSEYISSSPVSAGSAVGAKAAALALKQVGKRYVYGATGPNSFDCSGLVYYVYRSLGYTLARTATDQYYGAGQFVSKSLSAVQPGDLVFFYDRRNDSSGGRKPVTHVGIYIGDNQFVHASTSSTGVKINELFTGYYKDYLVAIKRIA